MLVLSRFINEKIYIGDDVVIKSSAFAATR